MPNGHIHLRSLSELFPLEVDPEGEDENAGTTKDKEEPPKIPESVTVEDEEEQVHIIDDNFEVNENMNTLANNGRNRKRYNLRENPKPKKGFSFYMLALILFILLTLPLLGLAVANKSCRLECMEHGVKVETASTEQFLLCCDKVNCTRNTKFLVVESNRLDDYSCEVVCFANEEKNDDMSKSHRIRCGKDGDQKVNEEAKNESSVRLWILLILGIVMLAGCSIVGGYLWYRARERNRQQNVAQSNRNREPPSIREMNNQIREASLAQRRLDARDRQEDIQLYTFTNYEPGISSGPRC
jgi:hypothetical protein